MTTLITYQIIADPEPEFVQQATSVEAEQLLRNRLFLQKNNRYHPLQEVRVGSDGHVLLLFNEFSRLGPPEDVGTLVARFF